MAITITSAAKEKSTKGFAVSFTDENDAATVPTSITWSLLDLNGAIINSRANVAVETPDSTIEIVLKGNDLTYKTQGKLRLLVEALYDSEDWGEDCPLKEEIEFPVENLTGVAS